MSQAICPSCQKKLQLPENMQPGTMLQCAGCSSKFLPPEPVIKMSVVKKKKRRKEKARRPVSTNSVVLYSILSAIVLLLGTLGLMFLLQPSHAKFNEQVVANYQRFSEILKQGMDLKRINNLQNFLQQFEKLAPQLTTTLESVRSISAPDDSKNLKVTFVSLIDTIQKFGTVEVPDLLKKLKGSAKDEQVAQSMLGTLMKISTLHESLILQQHEMAKVHGLLQIQVPKDRQFFLSRDE